MSENPVASSENKLSNELLSINSILDGNKAAEKTENQKDEQANDQDQNEEQAQEQEHDKNEKQIQSEDQNINADQEQDQNEGQNENIEEDQNESQNKNTNQDQSEEKDQNQNDDAQKTEDQIEKDNDKNVFATIDDQLELLVPSKNNQDVNENLNEDQVESTPDSQKIVSKSQSPKNIQTKKPQRTTLNLESIIHVKQPTHNLTPEEISRAADTYIQTEKIQLDDPMIVSEIIEELASRYIDLLSKNEYIQAQNILTKIQYLRDQFRTKDAVLFMEKHLEELKSKKAALENQLKSIRSVWKGKQKELDESFKKESEELQQKQQILWEKLEKDWSEPSKQRKYSKESKDLLLGRQAERYMVLIGDLEGAEMMKRKNKQLEKTETVEAYNEMSNDFENARSKLTNFFEKQENELEEQQRMKKLSLKNDELEEVALCRKKIEILQKMIVDESNPTFKEKKIMHSRLINSSELPMLQRTVKNISAKNKLFMKTAQVTSKPLHLPPLKMGPRPTKKAKSNLARPLAH